ncbi:alpha-glucosidase [Alkalihalobacillus sp. LMS39]|uniref:glycoside hydrolase family 13 protein n=1 Tax=Alkalihalobacillus sp. LMS39 TaxID=2924032 RepID=UPI001FB3F3CE|nr:alpha-glucosidase [Alkalihalobacillus sp. LMS39]UOE95374.1 alpha-glucosidase [Alkalihalobacillus sp. LMS39]
MEKRYWWKESVVYQIYPRSFMDSNGDGIGDLNGIISKLDYLQELGIDVVWLSPVYESPNDDNGYDISNYQAIMDEFGTMEDWERLLEEMHNRGIKLIMDLVVNHSSDEHAWFVESRKSKENKYRDYYIWRDGKDGKEPNNWSSFFSGSAWQFDEATEQYFLHLFSKKQPDLNWENPQLRKEVYDMMTWWLEKGIDGFRMDVINMISKEEGLPDAPSVPGEQYSSGHEFFMNGPRIHEFLQEMNKEVLSKYDILTVGETPGVSPEDAVLYTAEDRNEVNMLFQFEHMDLDSGNGKWDVKPLQLADLKWSLSRWQKGLENQGWNSLYWNNHDQPRIVSRFGNDKEYRNKSAKMLGTLLHMMKGTPYIYQGEEIGMTNVKFPDISDYKDIETINMYNEKLEAGLDKDSIMNSIYIKGRDNARTPMQWDDSEHSGFTIGTPWINVNPNYATINVKQALEDKDSVFYYYKKLIHTRKSNDIIIYGSYDIWQEDHSQVFAYTRTFKEQTLFVACNFYGDTTTITLPDIFASEQRQILITNDDEEQLNGTILTLKPYEAKVYLV